jgi:hypothetical protein
MISYEQMLVGTLGGAGVIGGTTDDEPITPTSVSYKSQARYGSAFIQAVKAGDAVLYAQRGGEKIREFVYNFERDKFVAPDMTLLAEHINDSGIVEMEFQSRPDQVLWCVLDNGDMTSFTYQREQDVVGWALHTTDGDFESVCVIPGSDEDEIWVVVNRTINSVTRRYIEQFQPRDWGDNQDDCWFVDSGLDWDGGDSVNITGVTQADPGVVTVDAWPSLADGTDLADGDQVKILSVSGMTELNGYIYTIDDANTTDLTFSLDNSAGSADVNTVGYTAYTSGGTVQRFEKTFTGFGHLEGEAMTVLADGVSHADVTVSSGEVTLTEWTNRAIFGLQYNSTLETLPLEIESQVGSIRGRVKAIPEITINFYKTLDAQYGTSASDLDDIPWDDVSDDLLYTGLVRCRRLTGRERDVTIFIYQQEPLPMTVRGIYPKLEIWE